MIDTSERNFGSLWGPDKNTFYYDMFSWVISSIVPYGGDFYCEVEFPIAEKVLCYFKVNCLNNLNLLTEYF